MHYSLIALMGNDQQLKDSIYQLYSGMASQDQQIPIPYSYSVLNTIQQHKSIQYNILNTPSTIKKDELISMWNNMIQICKLENFENCIIFYCFTDVQNDIIPLLNDVHIEMGCQINQNNILLLTQYQTLNDYVKKQEKNNNYKIILLDRYQLKNIFPLLKEKKQLNVTNIKPRIYQGNNLKEIADNKFNIIFTKWKEIITKSKTQAEFLKNILLEQSISQISDKLQVESQSQVQIFNLAVNIRQMLEERKKDFIDNLMPKSLKFSSFRYCSNQKCKWLFSYNSSNQLEHLHQIEIHLDNPSFQNYYCLACNNKICYITFSQIINDCFQEFSFRIINEVTQNSQQKDSTEILEKILQIMLLSNEEEVKTTIFNIIQQNYSTNERQSSQFVQSSIINNKYRFHNAPLFNFIQDSENTITQFKDYFYKNEIHFFLILVKFERTDMMIQKITNMIKKFHRLNRQRMVLIINQCQYDEEQFAEIKQKFAHFSFKNILFLHKSDCTEDICKNIFQNLENISLEKFDFTDSVFEQENDNSFQQLQKQNLINLSRQIDAEQQNNFRIQLEQDKEYLEKLQMEIKILQETLQQKKTEQNNLLYKYQQDSQKLKAWEKQGILVKF
ncbi:unnamed protein product [Paramecium primaurelia]|uniref:Uncharacterized protein n=1 Tax=Paramecium primaurelia TaxID=5886 RepID=A0A8S1QFM6_PARPR|nr:unnamed protein product [Paramecium primaurelia]